MSTTVSSFQNGSFLNGTASTSSLSTSGSVSISTFMNTDYLDSKYEYNQTKESYETKETAEDTALSSEIDNILYLLEAGYEDKAMDAYNELLTTMSEQTQYSTLSEKELQAAAQALLDTQVEEETDGEFTSIKDYIVEYAADANKNYMQKVWYCNDKVDSTTEEELLETICNIDTDNTVSAGTKVLGFLGNVITLGGITEAFDAIFGSKHH